MTEERRVALRLDTDPAAEPVRGLLTAQDGVAREFVGWLGLATEIERMLTARDARSPRGGPGADG